jgi:hypothetical protein
MTLYRAQYRTKSGTVRRMTLAADSMREAWRISADWQLRDDKLQAVATVPARRPDFKLTFSEVAA